MKNASSPTSDGLISAFFAYLIWGVLPFYWKISGIVPPLELIAWRVAGCGVLAWKQDLLILKEALKRLNKYG